MGYARLAFAYYSIALGLVDTLMTLFMASLSACFDPDEKNAFADSRDNQSWFITSRKRFKGPFGLGLAVLELFLFVRVIQTFRNGFIAPIFVTLVFLVASCGCLGAIPLHPDHYSNENIGLGAVWKIFFLPGVGLAFLWIDLRNSQTMPAILVGVTLGKAIIDIVLEVLPISLP